MLFYLISVSKRASFSWFRIVLYLLMYQYFVSNNHRYQESSHSYISIGNIYRILYIYMLYIHFQIHFRYLNIHFAAFQELIAQLNFVGMVDGARRTKPTSVYVLRNGQGHSAISVS